MKKRDAENISIVNHDRSEEGVVEVPVLLEARMLNSLETVAHVQGISTGTLLRSLLRDFLSYSDSGTSLRISREDSRTASLC